MINREYHLIETSTIEAEQIYSNDKQIVVDVRAPVEYAKGSILNSINIHIFDDDERAVIGSCYKKNGQEKALDLGYELLDVGWKKLLERFSFLPKDKIIVVTCARGGLRSKILSSILNTLGFNALQLKGGFQSYRKLITSKLLKIDIPYLVVLDGMAGSAKTKVLRKIENSINLEDIAEHSGSVFGHIDRNPLSQKEFDERLLRSLERVDKRKIVYIEAESRRIGKIEIPKKLFELMNAAPRIKLKADLEVRVKRMIKEYVRNNRKNQVELAKSIRALGTHINKELAEELITYVWSESYEKLWSLLLDKYYDKKYMHHIKRYKYKIELVTNNIEDPVKTLKDLVKVREILF